MKQQISGPVGIAIVVVVLIAIVAFGMKMFGGGPARHSNEEVAKHLGGAQGHGKGQ